MTTTTINMELIDLSAMEFDRPCMAYEVTCDRTAAWLLIGACCGAHTPMCQAHKDKTDADYSKYARGNCWRATCKECGARFILTFDDWRWEKL